MTRLSDHERAQGGTVTLSDEQFAKLVELLTPGYELAKAYMAQMNTPAQSVPEPTKNEPAPEPVKETKLNDANKLS